MVGEATFVDVAVNVAVCVNVAVGVIVFVGVAVKAVVAVGVNVLMGVALGTVPFVHKLKPSKLLPAKPHVLPSKYKLGE